MPFPPCGQAIMVCEVCDARGVADAAERPHASRQAHRRDVVLGVLSVARAATGSDESAVSEGKTILVVDDDPVLRDVVSWALEGEGYGVETAANGREALDKVRRDPPDAIVLDLVMPTMDGWGFLATQRMSSAECRAPVLAMSAVGGRYLARELGATDFLAKPFDVDDLLRRVDSLLAQHA